VTVRGARSTWDTSGSSLHVEGRLNIIDGGAVTSGYASIYPFSGTIGTTVSGLGSSWTTSGLMIGGYSGASCGVLNVVNGGKVVNSSFADIGGDLGVEGFVRVNGAGSSWNNTAAEGLSVGLWSGRGTMTVTGGGTVTASTASIGSTSLVSIDVSHGSTLNLGSGVGALTNDGIIRVCADANAPTGDYTPILAAAAWSGAGSCQPLGGVWNATSHVLSVFESMTGAAGNPVTIDDLRYAQRILVSDSGPGRTGWTVGAGFAPTTDMKSLSLTATVMDASLTQGLANKLALGQVLCSAWDFSASGYTSGDPVYLSFGIGAGRKWSDLHVWHRDASGWTEFLPNDLNYDGTYASFTASGFSGYAISVPEPGSLSLLGAICLILLAYRTRRRGVLG
jgi:T5SS/PEP-CTERM-associated repeat protein